ncbi:MAG: hypothetical protein R3C44_05515 [Chloroflexota bacterium]
MDGVAMDDGLERSWQPGPVWCGYCWWRRPSLLSCPSATRTYQPHIKSDTPGFLYLINLIIAITYLFASMLVAVKRG